MHASRSFKSRFSLPDDLHYLVYFYPGTILLMLLFTAIFSTISLIEDRRPSSGSGRRAAFGRPTSSSPATGSGPASPDWST